MTGPLSRPSRAACLAVAAVVLASGCTRRTQEAGASGPDGQRTAITVAGSDTMVILGQRWAEQYMKEHPEVVVQIKGGGSGTGIAALINGTTDVCQSSRSMKDKERAEVREKRGEEVVERPVALDAIALYVHPDNPLTGMTLADLRRLYLGEVTSWKELGGPDLPVVLYGRENNSGTYAYFKEHVLQNADFAPAVQTLAGTSAVVAAVKGDEGGIGYGGIAYTTGVKKLGVKADADAAPVAASLDTAQDGSYPLARPLFFYTAGPGGPAVQRFIDFVLSDAGQGIIEKVGYYPLATAGAPAPAATP